MKLEDIDSLGRSEEESMGEVEGQAGGSAENRKVIGDEDDSNSRGKQAIGTPSGEWG